MHGSPPNSVILWKNSRLASSPLHLLRVDYAFMHEKLFLFGTANYADSISCGFVEDVEHAL